jgi:TonB-linked SusC/RagA family outer membrane protein
MNFKKNEKTMKRAVLFLFCFLAGLLVAWGQTREIMGTVTSQADGSPLPGVTVILKGSNLGVTTDSNGKFIIRVPNNAQTLSFSFVGMESIEVAVGNQSVINVQLKPGEITVDEVVVVAYGTKAKKAITGAISSVTSDEISNQINVSPVKAIQGLAAGVNVITSGGQPGENPEIRIRGIGSVNAEAQPLIVVDGMVYSGNLNSIGSEQIKTMNILKDASASALYGSRAANGVILITTKGGVYGKKQTSITVNTRGGFSTPAIKNFELVGAEQYMMYLWEAHKNSKLYPASGAPLTEAASRQWATDNLIGTIRYNPYGTIAKPIGTDGLPVSGAKLLWDTDWYSELIRDKAWYDEVNMTFDGSAENISYFVSGSRLKQEGSVIESDFERYTGRVNLNGKMTRWLDFSTNNSFSTSSQNYPDQSGTSYTNTMQWINNVSNIFPVFARDAQGNLKTDAAGNTIYDYGNAAGQTVNASRPVFSGENVVGTTYYADIINKRYELFSSSSLKAHILKNLSFKSAFGYDFYLYDSYDYGHYKYGDAAGVRGRIDQEKNLTTTKTFTNSINYKNQFGKSGIGVDVISEVFDYKYDYFTAWGTGFLPDVKVMSGSTVPERVGGYINQERLVSYMGRADYNFDSKYYFDFSFRRDASTRFKSENRWGNFYSVGASWILSDEKFIKDLSDKITLLKFRTSYGELGNNRGIGYFPYFASFSTGWNNGDNTGVLKGGAVDENISWEKSALLSIGLDYGFFKNRINGSVEYYNKESVDLIFDQPLSPSLGSSKITTNIGDMRNSGIEFVINTVNVNSKSIRWTSSFNLASNKNELLKLPQEEIITASKKLRVGKSLFDFFIEEYAGVDPANGDALWYKDTGTPKKDDKGVVMKDKEGNIMYEDDYVKATTNKYSEASRYYQGSSLAKYIGGFSNYLKLKNFDVNLLFNYSFGGKILDGTYQGLMGSLSSVGRQLTTDIENRWQKPGDIADVPKLTISNNDYNQRSSKFLFKNNYIRLRALSAGYNMPESLLSIAKIKSCRFYLQADNIFTWQSHKGIDPEQNFAGTTDDRSNALKTWSLGIQLGF